MRAATGVVVTSLILALASSPMLTQPVLAQMPNPDLFEDSKENLKSIAAALKMYFADFARYPGSINELLIRDGPNGYYLVELPTDPCTGSAFGTPGGYAYFPVGIPHADYILRTYWSAASVGAQCYATNNNANLQYLPYRGFQLTP